MKLFDQYASDISSPEANHASSLPLLEPDVCRHGESKMRTSDICKHKELLKKFMEKVGQSCTQRIQDSKDQTVGVMLVLPRPCFVVKAKTNGGGKFFINVCTCNKVINPETVRQSRLC